MNYFSQSKWTSWFIAFLVVANITTITAFWLLKTNGNAHDTNRQNRGIDYLKKELAFTKEQNAQFDQMRLQHRQQMDSVRTLMHASKELFFGLLKQQKASDSLINAYAQKAAGYQKAIDLLVFKHFQQVRTMCTTEQKLKFDEIIGEVIRMGGPPPPEGDAPNKMDALRRLGNDGPPPPPGERTP